MSNRKILIGSPIRQKPAILERFLESLAGLNGEGLDISCRFVDDNTDPESSLMLRRFAAERTGVTIVPYVSFSDMRDEKDEPRHHWKEETVWKVAAMKDAILSWATDAGIDDVFLVDSDLVLHPETLRQLASAGKDIVSAVYWTCWQPGTMAMPQVWLHGEYEHYSLVRNEKPSDVERIRRMNLFFYELRRPGLYEVGGLGACTLISRNALLRGVRFAEIRNLAYWGEDRHFCVRAAALGFRLYVETTYPAYHIYRDSDLEGAERFRAEDVHAQAPAHDLYRQAVEMSGLGYEEGAADFFQRFISSEQGAAAELVDACLWMDAYYGRKGSASEGRALLLRMLGKVGRAEVYCRLGAKCMDEEKWDEAIVWFKMALKSDRPEDWEASTDITAWTWKPHIQLCVCYSRVGQLQKAYEHNETGLTFNADHPGMLSNRQYLGSLLTEARS